jgi:hypothetical protein
MKIADKVFSFKNLIRNPSRCGRGTHFLTQKTQTTIMNQSRCLISLLLANANGTIDLTVLRLENGHTQSSQDETLFMETVG